jgi:hypothetical protein
MTKLSMREGLNSIAHATTLKVIRKKQKQHGGNIYDVVDSTGKHVQYVLKNPARRNAPKSRTISLKGFTGKVRQLANGALQISGRGKKG